MSTRDAFRFINDLDEATVQAFINRLEFRGHDPTFCRLRDAYFAQLPLADAREVLDLGCGTGVIARALARHDGFAGRVIGIDQSPVLIEAAHRFAADEGLADRVEFRVGDVHALDCEADQFDCIITHTVLSHVTDPLAVLRESARVAAPGGAIAIFDGDYASLTFAYPDPVFAKAMDEALIAAVVNNPRILRELPHLLRQEGLEREDLLAWVYPDVGAGSFYRSAIEAFAPLVVRGGLLPAERVDEWLVYQQGAMTEGIFSGPATTTPTLSRAA